MASDESRCESSELSTPNSHCLASLASWRSNLISAHDAPSLGGGPPLLVGHEGAFAVGAAVHLAGEAVVEIPVFDPRDLDADGRERLFELVLEDVDAVDHRAVRIGRGERV